MVGFSVTAAEGDVRGVPTKNTPGERSLWPDGQVPGPLAPLRMDQSTCAIAGRGNASRASARRVASVLSYLMCRIEAFQFQARILGGELPIHLGLDAVT